MKVSAVEAVPVWDDGRRVNFFLVFVDTDEGITGIGEAALTSREHAVAGALAHLAPLVVGEDPFRTEHLWQTLARGGFFPAAGAVMAALSAIDIALWDIKARALGVPLYDLLGGRVRDEVPCYPHNTRSHVTGPKEDFGPFLESCQRTAAEGWRFVRCGVPQTEDGVLDQQAAARAALRQVQAVRQTLGEDIEICIDVHTRLDLPESVWLCRELEPLRPFFVEDPLRCENVDALGTLRAHTSAPIAAGEQFSSKWEFKRPIENEWIDYARIDPGLAGGITEARKIVGWCETHTIKTAFHAPLSPVLGAACLHLSLSAPNFGVQELPVRPGTILPDVFPMQPEWRGGSLLPPTRPGLGIEVDREAARRHPFQETEKQHLRARDGALTNW